MHIRLPPDDLRGVFQATTIEPNPTACRKKTGDSWNWVSGPATEGCSAALDEREEHLKPWREFLLVSAFSLAIPMSLVAIAVAKLIWDGPACMTESQRPKSEVTDHDFLVTTTYCSGFGGSARAKLTGRKKGDRADTLLFDYDPVYSIALPTITAGDEHTIVISVSWVSQIFARRHEWRGTRIDYHIGKVSYPEGERVLE